MNEFDTDETELPMKDYNVLKAEGEKTIADSKMAVHKLAHFEDAQEQLRQANEIWTRNSSKTS